MHPRTATNYINKKFTYCWSHSKTILFTVQIEPFNHRKMTDSESSRWFSKAIFDAYVDMCEISFKIPWSFIAFIIFILSCSSSYFSESLAHLKINSHKIRKILYALFAYFEPKKRLKNFNITQSFDISTKIYKL